MSLIADGNAAASQLMQGLLLCSPLYSTFIAPFAEPDAIRGVYLEEEWRTPQCYNVNTPPASSKISMFSDETLFYAFYAFPRDLLQMEVSAEL